MKTLKFKTNINCNGCLAAVTPVLEAEKRIKKWDVDLQSEERFLTVIAENISAAEVKQAIAEAGFEAEEIPA